MSLRLDATGVEKSAALGALQPADASKQAAWTVESPCPVDSRNRVPFHR